MSSTLVALPPSLGNSFSSLNEMTHACVLFALSALDDRYDTKVRRGDTEPRRGEHLEHFRDGVEDSTREVRSADARAFCCPKHVFTIDQGISAATHAISVQKWILESL